MTWIKDANRKYKHYEQSRRGFRIYCIRHPQWHSVIFERDGEKWRRRYHIPSRFLAINKAGLTFTRGNLVSLWEDIELYHAIGFVSSSSNRYNMNPALVNIPQPAAGEKDLPFEFALLALRTGQRVRRELWPRGVFVVIMPELQLPPYSTEDTTRKVNDRTAKWIGPHTPLNCHPYFAIYVPAGNVWQPGWIPNVYDILGEDWMVMDEKPFDLGME